ncbi:hypothetical protein EKL94_07795 [Stenotrophomonas maltophilia]|uniref:Uncharacterized protein n=1 Tax=Stenotrophomonas maltophilia TaxID=40324 RepID=A0A3S0KFI2_STEMA|nr:hypothetical protein EKL94_07795 [Stenotrophomonas maltophilia]
MGRRRRTCWTWWSSRPSRSDVEPTAGRLALEGRPKGRPSSLWVEPAAGRLPCGAPPTHGCCRPAAGTTGVAVTAPGSACRCRAAPLRPARGRAWRDTRLRR